MTYLFLGSDSPAKTARINEFKKKILPTPEAVEFDCDTLYAHKLSPDTLKKALIDLPAIGKKRMVIIRECHKLTSPNKRLIIEFLQNPPKTCDLILDSDEWGPRDGFPQEMAGLVKVLTMGRKKEMNVFDLTNLIYRGKQIAALDMLAQLISKGDHPLQILGGIAWFWGNAREKLSFPKFERGLKSLQEADLNIKRTRLKPEHALELLVVKLCEEYK